jgi:hypothetical protein
MIDGAKITMSADVDGDGSDETGVFDLSTGITLNPSIRTGDLIGGAGSSAFSIVDRVIGDDGQRAGFNLDIGGGAEVATIDFRSFEGSTGRWGDGTSNDQADAEGDSVQRQISVLFQYLRTGTYDSRNAIKLEWGEFSDPGVYEALNVTFEEPTLTFDADEQTSAFDGSITFVSTRSIEEATTASNQQNER